MKNSQAKRIGSIMRFAAGRQQRFRTAEPVVGLNFTRKEDSYVDPDYHFGIGFR